MSENGVEDKRSILKDLTDQLWPIILTWRRYGAWGMNRRKRWKRLILPQALFLFLVLTGFIGLQIVIIGLLDAGRIIVGDYQLFFLSVLYFAFAFGVYWTLGRRDKRVRAAFCRHLATVKLKEPFDGYKKSF